MLSALSLYCKTVSVSWFFGCINITKRLNISFFTWCDLVRLSLPSLGLPCFSQRRMFIWNPLQFIFRGRLKELFWGSADCVLNCEGKEEHEPIYHYSFLTSGTSSGKKVMISLAACLLCGSGVNIAQRSSVTVVSEMAVWSASGIDWLTLRSFPAKSYHLGWTNSNKERSVTSPLI